MKKYQQPIVEVDCDGVDVIMASDYTEDYFDDPWDTALVEDNQL